MLNPRSDLTATLQKKIWTLFLGASLLVCGDLISMPLIQGQTKVSQARAKTELVDIWLGTGRAKVSKGIYHCLLNTKTGKLTDPELMAEVSGPGFLAMHPNGERLYAVGTLNEVPSVIAYEIRKDGSKVALQYENSVPIGDGGAAHVAVNRSGSVLLTAQYGGGSVAIYRLDQEGRLLEQTGLIQHEGGSGVVENRQTTPHAHWVGFSPDQRFAFVPDLGLDQVVIYKVDEDQGSLAPHGVANVPPGGGPRHMKFHPNGRWIYVLNELALSVTVFDYDSQSGQMTAKQTLASVPAEQLVREKFASASEVRVHPNGRFLYSANRGHDTITVYQIHQETGELTVVEREHIRGATPRNFNLDPTATWLIAAGQDSNTLASFEVDQGDGRLIYNRSCVNAPNPICVLFGHE